MLESANTLRTLLQKEAVLFQELTTIDTQIKEGRTKLKDDLMALAPQHKELQDFIKFADPVSNLFKRGSAEAILLFRPNGLAITPYVSGYFAREMLALTLLKRLQKSWEQDVAINISRFKNYCDDGVITVNLALR